MVDNQQQTWNQLLTHLSRGGTYGHWWVKQEKRTVWWEVGNPTSLPEVKADVYFGVHPTSQIPRTNAEGLFVDPAKTRSRVAIVEAVNCLFGDFDAKDFESIDGLKKHIKSLKPFPSVIVSSGGGYHCYWLFKDPQILDTNGKREEAIELQKAWTKETGADKAVCDLARILRVPGTKNRKYPEGPREVKILRADFEYLFDPATLRSQGGGRSLESPEGLMTEKELREMLARALGAENGKKFGLLWNGDTEGYASASEADEALCCLLAFWLGGDKGKMDFAFRKSHLMREKWEREDYRSGTLDKAIGQVGERHQARGKYACTDIGNARRLVDQHCKDLRYCGTWKHWLCWDGVRWARDETEEVVRRAKKTAISIYEEIGEVEGVGDAAAAHRKKLAAHAIRSQSAQAVRNMVAMARSEEEIAVRPDQFDQDDWVLNVKNGVLDLRTGELREHERNEYFTKVAPVAYDAGARSVKWENFLWEILDQDDDDKTTELIRYVQKVVGYSLTGDTSEHAVFLLFGTGANGKSTFLQALSEMMGDYAMQTPTQTLLAKKFGGIPNDVARLKGSRLVTAVESGQGKRLSESLVKQMSGGDKISARFMRAEWFEFEPTFKIFLATNHKPYIRGTDYAIWRRLKLIPFLVQIPEEQQVKGYYEAVLQEELSGVLRWAVEGCLLWQKEGLGSAPAVVEATEEYRVEMDKVARFLEDECVVTGEDRDRAQCSAMLTTFQDWCEEVGEKTMGGRMLRSELKKKGIKTKKSGTSWYLGVLLKTAATKPEKELSGSSVMIDLSEVK